MIEWVLFAAMIILPFLWLRAAKEKEWKAILKDLFPKFKGVKKEIIGSLALFGALFIGFIVISAVLTLAGFNDLTKVNDVVQGEASGGAIMFLLSIVIILFIEEFFFRAFLVPRIGIIPSTFFFALAHTGYGSIAEIVGAFFLGLVLAYWYKKNNSLVQNYFGHLLYDLFALAMYLF